MKCRLVYLKQLIQWQADISVSKVKNVDKGEIVINYTSNVDSKKFGEMAESNLSEKYIIKKTKGLYPKIRVSGFPENHEPKVPVNLIHGQNKSIFIDKSKIEYQY